MKPETRQAIEEAKCSEDEMNLGYKEHEARIRKRYEHALTLAIAEIEELNKLYTESDLALQEYILKDEKNQDTLWEFAYEIQDLTHEIEELKAERVCPKEGCKHWAEETDVENREITEWCNYKGICNRMAFDQFKPKEDKNEKA
jgi:hypothetical protein